MNKTNKSLNGMAASATLHCLTGCAIGEVVGMVISTLLKFGSVASVFISIVLAFIFGYSLTIRPLLKHGMALRGSARVALASDTASITVMEITDNAFILAVPNAINANLDTKLFWLSLAISLAVAFAAAFPLNRYLIRHGKGHCSPHHH